MITEADSFVLQSFFPSNFSISEFFCFFSSRQFHTLPFVFVILGTFAVHSLAGKDGSSWIPRDPGKMYSKVSSYVWSWSSNWRILNTMKLEPVMNLNTACVQQGSWHMWADNSNRRPKRVCVFMKIMRLWPPPSLCSLNLLWALGHLKSLHSLGLFVLIILGRHQLTNTKAIILHSRKICWWVLTKIS